MNSFRYFVGIPWTGDRPIARPVPTQGSTTQKNVDVMPHAGFKPTISVLEQPEHYTRLRQRGHWDRPC